MKSIKEQIQDVANTQSVFRAGDIPVAEPRAALSRMVAQGELIRVGHGLFSLPEADIGENYALSEIVKRYPGGIVCLISALYFHGIGTQLPYETWIMRHDRRGAPKDGFPARFVYCSSDAFFHGIEEHMIDGIKVKIYSPVKTIADCFKYRNKIGLDVAIEALQEGWRSRQFTMDELWSAVTVCRVQKTIQPYLEMLVQ